MGRQDSFGEHLEARAERQGLPADPAAWRDGGVGVAAAAANAAEAELIAQQLNARQIPAWIDAPAISTWGVWPYMGRTPNRVSVLVPLGRLQDARSLVAAHHPSALVAEADLPEGRQGLAHLAAHDAETVRARARFLCLAALVAWFLAPLWVAHTVLLIGRLRAHRALFAETPAFRAAVRWTVAAIVASLAGMAALAGLIWCVAA